MDTLNELLVMCIPIIAGKNPSTLVEMNINNSGKMVGGEGDEDCLN